MTIARPSAMNTSRTQVRSSARKEETVRSGFCWILSGALSICRSKTVILYHTSPTIANRLSGRLPPSRRLHRQPVSGVVGWSAMFADVGLILPALNEEPVIGVTLDGLRGLGLGQVIVVDNGSPH